MSCSYKIFNIYFVIFQPFKRLQRIQNIIETQQCEIQALKISSQEDQGTSESIEKPVDKCFSIESCDLDETAL